MNLRKRKSKEKQVESPRNDADDIENTVTGHLTEEERALNKSSRGYKKVKLEERKTVLNEIVKTEDESGDFDDCEDDDSNRGEAEENADAEVSDKFVLKWKGL